jgi:16S rRNA (cytosine967-C5)-methyltransferase
MEEREYALSVLTRVFQEGGYASLIMREADHTDLNMAAVTEMVYGTIRNYDLLEYQWRIYAKGRVKKKVSLLLDLSVYQLFFMDHSQDYAVVNEMVKLAGAHEKGFVNAILHKVLQEGVRRPEGEDLQKAAIETSHPLWILQMWKAHYGLETALKTAYADQKRAAVYGRINTLKTSREKLEADPHFHFHNDLCFTYDGVLSHSACFERGEVVIQDIHSADVVTHLKLKPGLKVLDACAAPGTKTQEMAMFMEDQGEITACDLYEPRVDLIASLMKKTGTHCVKTRVRDASDGKDLEAESYERILCDVPCSGLGDLRHKPEIRLHASPADIDTLVKTQRKILEASWPALKKEGYLLYSTCTLNRKENEKQIEGFLKDHPEAELIEEKTVFPFEEDGDGFYHALLKRH